MWTGRRRRVAAGSSIEAVTLPLVGLAAAAISNGQVAVATIAVGLAAATLVICALLRLHDRRLEQQRQQHVLEIVEKAVGRCRVDQVPEVVRAVCASPTQDPSVARSGGQRKRRR